MRKKILVALAVLMSVVALGSSKVAIGTIYDEDFRSVGVTEQNIGRAKNVISEAKKTHQLLILERKQLELEINKYMLEGSKKNWEKISNIFDKMGQIEANLMKNKLKSQIEIRQYISEDQYIKARGRAIKRLEANKENNVEK